MGPDVTPGVNSSAWSPDLEPASVGCLTSRELLATPEPWVSSGLKGGSATPTILGLVT